uniref:Ig-like domain-containing protein n=1 Tax=Terrapene triunguis TaxID=2587831 RepID=A0A674K0S9_9SAUR
MQEHIIFLQPGESTQLTLAVSGFVPNDRWMAWVRQQQGKGLELLVHYRQSSVTNFYSPSIQGRFTAFKDSSNFYLQMTSLKAEDTAVYYCARDTDTHISSYGHRTELYKETEALLIPFPLLNRDGFYPISAALTLLLRPSHSNSKIISRNVAKKQTNKHTHKHTHKQTNKQQNKQTQKYSGVSLQSLFPHSVTRLPWERNGSIT